MDLKLNGLRYQAHLNYFIRLEATLMTVIFGTTMARQLRAPSWLSITSSRDTQTSKFLISLSRDQILAQIWAHSSGRFPVQPGQREQTQRCFLRCLGFLLTTSHM